MRLLADEGVVSGESGACTVGALVALVSRHGDLHPGTDDVVLVLSTEGATDPPHYRVVVGRTAEQVAVSGRRDPAEQGA